MKYYKIHGLLVYICSMLDDLIWRSKINVWVVTREDFVVPNVTVETTPIMDRCQTNPHFNNTKKFQ